MQLLFADDDPILREFAAVHLTTAETAVDLAVDGAEAWAMLERKRYDILLVDLEMPRMNGFDVLSAVRGSRTLGSLPVMVITGREDVAAIEQAYRLGATTFFTKPINWPLLNYQVLFVHRAALAEAALSGPDPRDRLAESRVIRAAGRLAEEGRGVLRALERLGCEEADDAARSWRRALAELADAAT